MIVGAHDTAAALGSGDVSVLATPRLVALLEQATCNAIFGTVEPDHTSVGTAVDISHRRPSPIGTRVVAHARIESVEGMRVVFEVWAEHETTPGEPRESIARGRITRVVVDRASFPG